MNIVAFGASTSSQSINRTLAHYAARRYQALHAPGSELHLLDLNDFEMPLFSVDREKDGGLPDGALPDGAQRFIDVIGRADAVIVSFAEHNGGFSAAYKNLFDWASRIEKKVFQDTPALFFSTSPGKRGAASSLRTALTSASHIGAEVAASLSVPTFYEVYDAEAGALRAGPLRDRFESALQRLAIRVGSLDGSVPKSPSAAFWDQRFSEKHVAYGTEPNDFVRFTAPQIPEGEVLVVAAGEGRNALYLAERGYAVTAVDMSEVGLQNAQERAKERGLTLQTVVSNLADYDFEPGRFSAVISVWTHLPPLLRKKVFARASASLVQGGAFVLEAYAPAHLDLPGEGGPPMRELLMDGRTLRDELGDLDYRICQEVRRDIQEGRYHQGLSATMQLLGFRR